MVIAEVLFVAVPRASRPPVLSSCSRLWCHSQTKLSTNYGNRACDFTHRPSSVVTTEIGLVTSLTDRAL